MGRRYAVRVAEGEPGMVRQLEWRPTVNFLDRPVFMVGEPARRALHARTRGRLGPTPNSTERSLVCEGLSIFARPCDLDLDPVSCRAPPREPHGLWAGPRLLVPFGSRAPVDSGSAPSPRPMAHRRNGQGNHHANTIHLSGYTRDSIPPRAPLVFKLHDSNTPTVEWEKITSRSKLSRHLNMRFGERVPPPIVDSASRQPDPRSLADRLSNSSPTSAPSSPAEANLHEAVNEGGRRGANACYFLGAEDESAYREDRAAMYFQRAADRGHKLAAQKLTILKAVREADALLPVALAQLRKEHQTKVPGVKGSAVAFLHPLLQKVISKLMKISTLPTSLDGFEELQVTLKVVAKLNKPEDHEGQRAAGGGRSTLELRDRLELFCYFSTYYVYFAKVLRTTRWLGGPLTPFSTPSLHTT